MTTEYKEIYIENLYYSLISISGLFLLILLVLYSPNPKISYYFQKQLILSVFIIICILGMVAAVSPSRCAEFLSLRHYQKSDHKSNKIEKRSNFGKKFKGHHPECDNFKTHTFSLMEKKYCAGCSGLFIGALIAVIGTIIYYFYGISDGIDGRLIFFIGFTSVLIYLLKDVLFDINFNVAKFLFNMILVLGSFLILIGIIELNSSIFIQLFFMVLVFIWILGRIASSEKNHYQVCNKCSTKSSCTYR